MKMDQKIPLTACPTCGAKSTDLSTTWPDPEYLPELCLGAWKINWRALSTRAMLDCSCVVCATVVSVVMDAEKEYGCIVRVELTYIQAHKTSLTQRYLLTLSQISRPSEEWMLKYSNVDDSFILRQAATSTAISIEPLANTLPGIYEPCENIPVSSDSPEAFELARRWLHTCRTNHALCSSGLQPFIPSRILDVHSMNPKLVLREDLQDSQDMKMIKYVALSHCWGMSHPLKTVRSNLESHRKEIPFEVLPVTFKDAVKATRKLGLRYLWIDTLCILQDEDKEDWEREASQMENVYGNAELVLAATVASSPEAGFLRDRPGFDIGHVSTRLHTTPIESKYRLYKPHFLNPRNSPLDSRAWAFQERLLARRRLSYENSEMRWECRESSFCECGWAFGETQHVRHDRCLDNIIASTSHVHRMEMWQDIVSNYTRRKLTVASDKLMALSAVASRFQFQYGDEYLAGLWREHLIHLLLWRASSDSRPENFYAPSWSWISVNADFIFYPVAFQVTPKATFTLATVVNASMTTSTANKFGPVSEGCVRLRGKAIEAVLHVDMLKASSRAKEMLYAQIEIPRSPYEPSCFLDMPVTAHDLKPSDGVGRTGEAPARRISHTEKSLHQDYPSRYAVTMLPMLVRDKDIYSLVLGPSLTHAGCFERLGISQWSSNIVSKIEVFLTRYEDVELLIV